MNSCLLQETGWTRQELGCKTKTQRWEMLKSSVELQSCWQSSLNMWSRDIDTGVTDDSDWMQSYSSSCGNEKEELQLTVKVQRFHIQIVSVLFSISTHRNFLLRHVLIVVLICGWNTTGRFSHLWLLCLSLISFVFLLFLVFKTENCEFCFTSKMKTTEFCVSLSLAEFLLCSRVSVVLRCIGALAQPTVCLYLYWALMLGSDWLRHNPRHQVSRFCRKKSKEEQISIWFSGENNKNIIDPRERGNLHVWFFCVVVRSCRKQYVSDQQTTHTGTESSIKCFQAHFLFLEECWIVQSMKTGTEFCPWL